MSRGTADPRQLGLALAPAPALGRADFLPAAPNAVALALIEAPGGLPGGRLVLHGPQGAGKTHLAAIWAARTGAAWIRPDALAPALPALLADRTSTNLVIDDAPTLAGGDGEEALFHLLNHRVTSGGQILLTARAPSRDWGLRLPDLASRLAAAQHAGVGAPDDALLTAVLVKLFADRQAQVAPDVIVWLAPRIERSFAAAQAVVAHLDTEALRRRAAITRPFAQAVLDGAPGFGDTGPGSA